MKIIYALILPFFIATNSIAQNINTVLPKTFEVVVFFGSKCCGPAKDNFLLEFLSEFKLKTNSSINAWRQGGCGREGENKIFISITNLKKRKQKQFIQSIKKSVFQQNERNKKINESTGDILLSYDILVSASNNCSGVLTPYPKQDKL